MKRTKNKLSIIRKVKAPAAPWRLVVDLGKLFNLQGKGSTELQFGDFQFVIKAGEAK